MKKLIAKELKIKFIETLNGLDYFSYEEGNPFLIKIGSKRYFIFLKNLSPAYFKNSPDVTRVQLPFSDRFSKILKGNTPFIILGYDVENDTVVCWNPKKTKDRLNAKGNVSLYSRLSLQRHVKNDEFKFGYLKNGEKIVLFKRENLTFFFDIIVNVFKKTSVIDSIPVATAKNHLSDKQRFVLWLQEKWSENTIKAYVYCIEKITKDLKEISALKQQSLFNVEKPSKLRVLYDKWISIPKFKNKDLIAKYQNSNSFKRFIDFREYEKELNSNQAQNNSTLSPPNNTGNVLFEITDKELLQAIKPLLKKNQVLQAVEITSKYFENNYENMSFKDWYKVINELYKEIKK